MSTQSLRQLIGSANEDAAEFFRAHLLARPADGPRSYLKDRGFAAVLHSTHWTVGYAPDSWTALHDHLSNVGYSDQTMLEAGLISVSRRGTPIDRFRNRITFGIRDADSTLVGFTARAAPTSSSGTPKYLNTPRTAAYDKSATPFGLGEATRQPGPETTVLVEGPLDAIAVNLVDHVRWAPIALCGTALTSSHATRIEQLGHQVLLTFDNDVAGHRGLEKAITLLTPRLGEPRAARLSSHSDPAELLKRGGAGGLRDALKACTPASDLVVSLLLESWGDTSDNAERSICCLRDVARTLCRLSVTDVAHHATRLGEALGVGSATVTRELVAAATSQFEGCRRAQRTAQQSLRRGQRSRTTFTRNSSPLDPLDL